MILAAFLLGATVLASASTGITLSDFNFKIAVRDDGVYLVNFDSFAYNGPRPESASLFLSERGMAVPLQIDDGGDGFFGPGDSFTFNGYSSVSVTSQ